MSTPPQDSSHSPLPPDSPFDSRDSTIVVVDVSGNSTPQPVTGKAREALLRERDKLVRYGLLPPLPEQEKRPDNPESSPPQP